MPHFNPRTPCGVRPSRRGGPVCPKYFNPRTPCGVRPPPQTRRPPRNGRFQSTHPMRGATCGSRSPSHSRRHFNPRTPCGVRRSQRSSHRAARKFQSTHPMRGATHGHHAHKAFVTISIHAPHAGCDKRVPRHEKRGGDFNPRTPCGVRRSAAGCSCRNTNFNPRTPCGVRPTSSHR